MLISCLFIVPSCRFAICDFALVSTVVFNEMLLTFARGSIEDGVKRYNLAPIEGREVINTAKTLSNITQSQDCPFYHHSMNAMLNL